MLAYSGAPVWASKKEEIQRKKKIKIYLDLCFTEEFLTTKTIILKH